MFNQYPYINIEDLNLDYLMARMRNLEQIVKNFVALESVTFSDPIQWSIASQYAKNVIVLDANGNAFLSKKAVPVGVGLDNEDYWLEIFNFMDYVKSFNSNLTFNIEANTDRASVAYSVDDWLLLDDVLYKVTAAIAQDELFVVGTNIVHFTVEDFIKAWINYANGLIVQYKNDIDASELEYRNQLARDVADTTAALQAQLDLAISGATVDSEVINARLGFNGITYSTLGEAIRTQLGIIGEVVTTEQGGIDINGTETVNANRIRTGYLHGNCQLSIAENTLRIKYVYHFDPSTGRLISADVLNNQNYIVNSPDDLIRVSIGTTDGSSPVAPSDCTLYLIPYKVNESLTAETEKIGDLDAHIYENIALEQGNINSSGQETVAANRLRTPLLTDYGKFNTNSATANILYALYYTKDTNEFVRRATIMAPEYTFSDMNLNVRLTIGLSSDGNLTPNDVKLTLEVPSLNEALGAARTQDTLYTIPMEQGSVNALGDYTVNPNRIRSTIFIDGTVTLDLIAEQYTRIYSIVVFEKDGTFRSDLSLTPLTQSVTLTLNGYMVKVICAKRTAGDPTYNQPLSPSDVVLLCNSNVNPLEASSDYMNGMYDVARKIKTLDNVVEYTGTEKFNIDTNLREYTSIDIDFSDTANFMDNIYTLFDDLVANNSSYVTRFDLPDLYSISYPAYASGYKMYGYLLYNSIANIGAYDGGSHPMPTIILTGALHGNEYAAPYNLYLLAKELCEDYLSDDNLFKIRSSFKILIVPCVNGWGLNNADRYNYNNVDINRNFDCDNWTAGPNTGAAAGDQFETQVIMAAINANKPKAVIDCHNYSRVDTRQFYASICNPRLLNMSYRAITEIAYAIKKKYPEYFGSNFGTITEVAGAAPYQLSPTTMGTLSVYAYLNGVKVSSTLEINSCINYNGGVSTPSTEIDLYGTNTFAVGEYTLRNQLLRYMQYILDTMQN